MSKVLSQLITNSCNFVNSLVWVMQYPNTLLLLECFADNNKIEQFCQYIETIVMTITTRLIHSTKENKTKEKTVSIKVILQFCSKYS